VVGLRLGCLNHALLTLSAIQEKGLLLHGWIANQIDPQFTFIEEYLQTLQSHITAPMLDYLPYQGSSR
jgi:dethiobiotin synthetase